jgi:hypothetical protein
MLLSTASKKWRDTHKELNENHMKAERVTERIKHRHNERDGHNIEMVTGLTVS